MTKIKLCGLTRPEDIQGANGLSPDYVGFVFAPRSRRYVPPEAAAALREQLRPGIAAVGVFVDASPEMVAGLLNCGVLDMAQLHGREDAAYLTALRDLTDKPLIQAFRIQTERDVLTAEHSQADYVLLDSGAGTGMTFDWNLLQRIRRPYFLAGGLDAGNVGGAISALHPFAVDVSSGIESGGVKDYEKMRQFVRAVRGADGKEQNHDQ